MAKNVNYIVDLGGWMEDFETTSSLKEAKKLQKRMQVRENESARELDIPADEIHIYKVERVS